MWCIQSPPVIRRFSPNTGGMEPHWALLLSKQQVIGFLGLTQSLLQPQLYSLLCTKYLDAKRWVGIASEYLHLRRPSTNRTCLVGYGFHHGIYLGTHLLFGEFPQCTQGKLTPTNNISFEIHNSLDTYLGVNVYSRHLTKDQTTWHQRSKPDWPGLKMS